MHQAEHMDAVNRILRYLKGSLRKGLLFFKNGVTIIEGYMYVDWIGNQTTRKSTSSYFTFVEGNLVTWRRKKQKVVPRSSTKAKFQGIAHGVCKLLWIWSVLRYLGIECASFSWSSL